jgi:hypothetical protein
MKGSLHLLTATIFVAAFGQIAMAFCPHNQLATKKTLRPYKRSSSSISTLQARPRLVASQLHVSSQNNDEENTLAINIATFGVVLLSIFSSLGVFWSEMAIFQTGCGPLSMPDWLERSAYLGVLVVSGLSLFWRIVTFGDEGLASILSSSTNSTTRRTFLQGVEALTFLAVSGAIIVLANQALNGETMDGLSGIDLQMCATRQAFLSSTN